MPEIVTNFPETIALVGMPGSGKTTLGKELAAQLSYAFIDLDEEIEKQEKLNISEIFAQKGENYFREIEAEKLKNILSGPGKKVIATGGGTPCFLDNMLLLKQYAAVVWLNFPAEILAERLLKQDLKLRPLLKDKKPETIQKYLIETLGQRKPFYKQAHLNYHDYSGELTDLFLQLMAITK